MITQEFKAAAYATIFCTPAAPRKKSLQQMEMGRKPCETMDSLRYRRFCEKVVKNTILVEIKSLPPTTTAAKFHSLHVHYQQVHLCIGNERTLQPLDWRWKVTDDMMYAMMTEMPSVPKLLKMIRKKCTTGCGRKNVSCRRYAILY